MSLGTFGACSGATSLNPYSNGICSMREQQGNLREPTEVS